MERWRESTITAILCLARDRRAQDMVEYALIAGFIAVVVATVIPFTAIPAVSHIYSRLNAVCSTFVGN